MRKISKLFLKKAFRVNQDDILFLFDLMRKSLKFEQHSQTKARKDTFLLVFSSFEVFLNVKKYTILIQRQGMIKIKTSEQSKKIRETSEQSKKLGNL